MGDCQKFWKEPIKGTRISLWECGSNSFHPKTYQFYNKTSLYPFFQLNILQGTRITRTVVILNTLSGTKPGILTPKRHDGHPINFIWNFPPEEIHLLYFLYVVIAKMLFSTLTWVISWSSLIDITYATALLISTCETLQKVTCTMHC